MDCHAVTVIAQFNKPLFLSGPVDSMAFPVEDVTAVLVVVRIDSDPLTLSLWCCREQLASGSGISARRLPFRGS